jgi:hypothetical protein
MVADKDLVFDFLFDLFDVYVGQRGRDWNFKSFSNSYIEVESYIPVSTSDANRIESELYEIQDATNWRVAMSNDLEGMITIECQPD